MTKLTEQDLLDLKQEIDESKNEVTRLEGRKQHLMEQLSKDWGCKTIAEADKKIKQLGKDIEDLNQKIKTGFDELEQKLTVEES